jgi:hypothetical protein
MPVPEKPRQCNLTELIREITLVINSSRSAQCNVIHFDPPRLAPNVHARMYLRAITRTRSARDNARSARGGYRRGT